MSQRFTIDGSPSLEAHLASVCSQVRDAVQLIIPGRRLEGLVLAGGYGRGEGGVLRTAEGDAPYNDLEFFVFVRGNTWWNDRRYRRALHALGERLSPIAGIDVEFKILSIGKFRRSAASMFYYDLMMGHHWLIGDDTLFAGCEHHREASKIPSHEVTRLLFNRCSGLLFAKERLQREDFNADDADYVRRNLAKAQLALGDALLASIGHYHWSCEERHRRLQLVPGATLSLQAHHAQGVSFKLHPYQSNETRAQLLQQHRDIAALAERMFLRIESLRLGQFFDSPRSYAVSDSNKCPEHAWWKNILLNLAQRRVDAGLARYPREQLLRRLASNLWGRDHVNIQDVRAYEVLWGRFN